MTKWFKYATLQCRKCSPPEALYKERGERRKGMKNPKSDADPAEEPRKIAEYAEKKVNKECGYFGWWGLFKLLFFGKI